MGDPCYHCRMSNASNDFEAVKKRILAEFAAQGFGDEMLSFQKAMQLREYAKARTDLRSSAQLTMEQTIWKRSEEHTSELQSRSDLVCRLLLEKKHHNH